ncbi:hypothetical protein A2Z33_06360 [Candidatus Gottesmanbacteria bacterium RBG_16_52_11]|uniref:histidine kinase n=1 Tax=Candidatus Gottesmanbacteria bacterium RBG_16_52_11 TaxID=1798374 RepID=A0A1F5YXS2_9BACT|nr:MAG: hypothetical protein A2Z33_06360 [Candidatus Gottesmanbacteria bacterium RBG_16_52_11]
MTIFRSARLKLTAWYLLIIMAVSLLFSGIVYRIMTQELRRGFGLQILRQMPHDIREEYLEKVREQAIPLPFRGLAVPVAIDEELFSEIRRRIAVNLGLVNLGILGLSGIASYFLAGRTLRPIEDMVDAQKRFIADASHEMRTPLTSIKSEIEVALRQKALTSRQARSVLRSNLEEVGKMQGFTDYLLTLSKYETGEISLPVEPVNLRTSVEEAVRRQRQHIRNRDITVNTQTPDVYVKANPESLTELVTILLDNAVKYSPEGSAVNIRISRGRSAARLEVKDRGQGIKASDVPYIFNRFYRADTSRSKHSADGYGLGLSIAKSIAGMYRGDIAVRSTPGKGSTFTVSLPV